MRNLHTLFIVGLLASVSCSPDIELPSPDTLYEVELKDGSGAGVAIFKAETTPLAGTYYSDNGALYARADIVTVEQKGGKLLMVFDDGSKKAFSFHPYEVPTYPNPELPEVKPYLDSTYTVTPETKVSYATAKGYWTSYPKVPGKSFTEIFLDRVKNLGDKMDDCPLEMDVYLPEETEEYLRPLFLLIHGGAFFYEDKGDPDYVALCNYFASRGYVAASINYRMGFLPYGGGTTRAGYRALQDAHAAARYLVGWKDYRIDAERVFLAGNSAGAITALNLAFMRDEDRPESTKPGHIAKMVEKIGGSFIIRQLGWENEMELLKALVSEDSDMGPIAAVSPLDTTRFTVRAVGNMWGAVQDLEILKNANVPIVSFHSEKDPTVSFGYDYPFHDYFHEDLFKRIPKGSFVDRVLRFIRLRERLNRTAFDKMHGSGDIDRKARALGYKSKLYKYTEHQHSLHLNDADSVVYSRLYDIADKMAEFFAEQMETAPVNLHLDGREGPWVKIDNSEVRRLYWRVDGGVVRETAPDGIRVLLFPDARNRSVTVHGDYNSRTTFKQELKL